MEKETQEVRELRCSFCGNSQRKVQKLIAGPTAYICNECILLCNDIIAEEHSRTAGRPLVKPGEPSQGVRLTAFARAVHEIADSLRGQWISARPDVTESVLQLADSLDSVSDALQSEADRAEDLAEPH